MSISRIAVLNLFEAECAKNPELLARARKNGKLLLADIKGMSDNEIVNRLEHIGLAITKDVLAETIQELSSAADLEDLLLSKAEIESLTDADDDFAWMSLIVLWERWFPDIPNEEMLDCSMQKGYQLYEEGRQFDALKEWEHTWAMIKDLAEELSIKSVKDFDDRFPETQSLFNWVSDYAYELPNKETLDNWPSFQSFTAEFNEVFPLSTDLFLPQELPRTPSATTIHTKIGRNAPCPCGSGKKYKKCCGGPV